MTPRVADAASRLDVLEERLRGMDEARRLQASEYERRLGGLNNEATRLDRAVAANVSKDTWDGFQQIYNNAHASLTQQVKRTEDFQAKLVGAFILASFIVPTVTGLIVYVVTK